MSKTSDLIENLSSEAASPKQLHSPRGLSIRLLAILVLYGVGAQLFLGVRPELTTQFARPCFVAEVALLALLLITSVIASVVAMVPDAYQKPTLLKLPYFVFFLLFMLVLLQLLFPHDARMIFPDVDNGMECSFCIAAIALIPSALVFALLRKGASIHQLQSGTFAVLTAASIGCLTLRLAEQNDSLAHLVTWHYLPTLAFAAIGAFIGKWLLKW